MSRRFRAVYVGCAPLAAGSPANMLPWVVAGVRRTSQHTPVDLHLSGRSLRATTKTQILFEHELHTISKFAHSSQDPCCFSYMTTGPCAYHVFQAEDENTVLELFTAIKEMSKGFPPQGCDFMVKSASGVALSSFMNSCQQYEVLYVGRIKVSGARAPATFIDYAVEKFRLYEFEKAQSTKNFYKLHCHGSSASISSLSENSCFENPSKIIPQQKIQISSKEDLTSSSGVGSCESLSQKTLHSIIQSSEVRPRAYSSPASHHHHANRTMLFLIGRLEICLIGTDKKQIVWSKTFNDIASCKQGAKYSDHFGFVCRESTHSGTDCHYGYIFQCQTESVADELLQTIKLAFTRVLETYQKFPGKNPTVSQVLICDHCPMQWFYKLCSEVEGISPEETHLVILKRLGTLPDIDKERIIVKFQSFCCKDVQEQNEILMMSIREFLEQKQLNHTHDCEKSNTINVKDRASKLDSFRQKARSTLSNSFETFLKLSNRDDLKSSITNQSLVEIKSLPGEVLKGAEYLPDVRPRSSTFSSMRETHLLQNKRPVRFMKYGNETPVPTECKGSWRQAIFHHLQTPRGDPNKWILNLTPREGAPIKRTKEELRSLWKKAIFEQIILIRMEKENLKLQANQDAVCHKRLKLNYKDITLCIEESTLDWEERLKYSSGYDIQRDKTKLIEAVKTGVPRHKRGEIWQYLAEQNRMSNSIEVLDVSYRELVKQLTSHQHAILIDIGRTFPSHPFYAPPLGPGQLSLFNLLKAYSLLDPEVGYCQGLSFVAGILLLHMAEEEAFLMLRYLMFEVGLRKQFKADMMVFHIQMYQLSRLLHDHEGELYNHFDKFDIGPTLYAAPWFLTLFASQFPVEFVARLFDLIFLFGMDVIFKVSLLLLRNFKDCILKCNSFESTLNFIKTSLPLIEVMDMQILFNQVFQVELGRCLPAYEAEYRLMHQDKLGGRIAGLSFRE